MKVSVVIINWNGEDKLRRFLPQVLKIKGVDEYIVTDDASQDQSLKLLQDNYPQVRIVKRETNGGFSSNVNSGVRAASGELVFLLNPDAVPEKDCIGKALPFFKDPEVFSVGCNTGGNWSWAKWEKGFFWHYMVKGNSQTHETLWARGGSGIFKKSIFNQLGGMDELFDPYYEEDMDLGYRAWKQGYKNYWVKECRVHLPNEKGVIATNIKPPEFTKIAQRNQLIFIWKEIHDPGWIRSHFYALLKQLLSHPKYFPVVYSALQKWPEIFEKRQLEKQSAKITDRELLDRFSSALPTYELNANI